MTKVRCTVESCDFWGKGQVCNADEIWVKNDIAGDPDQFNNHFINASQTEFGEEMGEKADQEQQKQTEAKTSGQTCCDTMRPKRGKDTGCCCK